MELSTARLIERIHGHVGFLAIVALAHPALLLRKPGRRAKIAVLASTLVATLAVVLGATIYPTYSKELRKEIYLASMRHGYLFERKEHLAFAALALAWTGCVLHLGASDEPGARSREKAAHYAFVGASLIALLVGLLGMRVASFRSF